MIEFHPRWVTVEQTSDPCWHVRLLQNECVWHLGISSDKFKEQAAHEEWTRSSRHSYFCLSKFRSGPVTLEAARVFHVAQPLGKGLDLRLPILSPSSSFSSIKASLFPRHSLLQAGKSAQAALETDRLRRRPGRCTEDKFVFVSRAATLGGRTLSRSCRILPPLENT